MFFLVILNMAHCTALKKKKASRESNTAALIETESLKLDRKQGSTSAVLRFNSSSDISCQVYIAPQFMLPSQRRQLTETMQQCSKVGSKEIRTFEFEFGELEEDLLYSAEVIVWLSSTKKEDAETHLVDQTEADTKPRQLKYLRVSLPSRAAELHASAIDKQSSIRLFYEQIRPFEGCKKEIIKTGEHAFIAKFVDPDARKVSFQGYASSVGMFLKDVAPRFRLQFNAIRPSKNLMLVADEEAPVDLGKVPKVLNMELVNGDQRKVLKSEPLVRSANLIKIDTRQDLVLNISTENVPSSSFVEVQIRSSSRSEDVQCYFPVSDSIKLPADVIPKSSADILVNLRVFSWLNQAEPGKDLWAVNFNDWRLARSEDRT